MHATAPEHTDKHLMVDDVCPGTLVRLQAVMRTEINIHLPVFELLPGQGQWMAAAVAK